jgi:hypothetical protein
MSETAAPERVTLTREEYEILRGGQPATVTVDAAEYSKLIAGQAANDKQAAENQRVMVRLRELENMLKREQQEHNLELNQAVARIKQLGG